MFRIRALKQIDGGMLRPRHRLTSCSRGKVVNTTEAQLIVNGMAYVSGEIPRLTAFERGMPGQYRKKLHGEGWEPDELVMDERFVAVNVAGKGLVVFTACSHAGIINVLKHAKAAFKDVPIHAVVGGLHLAGPNEEIIPETVASMLEFNPAYIVVGRCTGWRAITALANAFGHEKLVPLSVGKRFCSESGSSPIKPPAPIRIRIWSIAQYLI